MDQSISLNKFISDTGYCSRREADNLINAGRVLLNNQPAVAGNRYKPGDVVEVDGSIVTAANKDKRVYLALNKPTGITTTTELHIKDNIISFIGYPKRIFPIGRLDKDSEGLILLTNDGDIINKILRADNNHEKEYIVRVNKPYDHHFIQQMSQGVPILETRTLPCKVQMMGRQTFRITLTQGLNRQIRRMCEYLGYNVVGLQRVRIMNIKLDKLALGKWRYLSEAELSVLNENLAHSEKIETSRKPEGRTRKFGGNKTKPASDDSRPAVKSGDNEGVKGTKPQARESSFKKEDKDKRPWMRDKVAGKTATPRNGKKARSEKGKSDNNKGRKERKGSGAEGSFKSYRSKGRR